MGEEEKRWEDRVEKKKEKERVLRAVESRERTPWKCTYTQELERTLHWTSLLQKNHSTPSYLESYIKDEKTKSSTVPKLALGGATNPTYMD